ARDDAAVVHVGTAHVLGVDELGQARGEVAIRDRAAARHVRPRYVGVQIRCDTLRFRLLDARDDPAAAVREAAAPGEREAVRLVVTVLGLAVLCIASEPVQIFVQEQVQYTGYCVRAPRGRGAAGDHLG